MTPKNFAQYVRRQTKTNTTTLTDETLLLYANIVKNDTIAPKIAKANEDIFGMVYYRDLVRGQREYSLPEYIVNNIKYTEVDEVLYTNPDSLTSQIKQFDSTCPVDGNLPMIEASGKYKRCDELDRNTIKGGTDEESIRHYIQFTREKTPAFDIFRNSIWLLTAFEVPPIKDGLKLHAMRYPDDIDDLSSNADMANDMIHPISSGIPRQFHLIWADMVCVMYKNSKDKPIPLTQSEQLVEQRLLTALSDITEMNLDRTTQSSVPTYDFGSNY